MSFLFVIEYVFEFNQIKIQIYYHIYVLYFRPHGKGSVGKCTARVSPSLLSESQLFSILAVSMRIAILCCLKKAYILLFGAHNKIYLLIRNSGFFPNWLLLWVVSCIFQIAKCICLNCLMYFSKLQNVFVWIAKCIFPNCKMYLSELPNVFFQIAKCIFQIANCIWLSSHSTSEAALGFSEKAGNWASFQTKYAANDKSLMLCSWDGIISTAVDKCGWKWIK